MTTQAETPAMERKKKPQWKKDVLKSIRNMDARQFLNEINARCIDHDGDMADEDFGCEMLEAYVAMQAPTVGEAVPTADDEAVAREIADIVESANRSGIFDPTKQVAAILAKHRVGQAHESEDYGWHCGSDPESEFFWCKPKQSISDADVLWFSTILDAQTACNALNVTAYRQTVPQAAPYGAESGLREALIKAARKIYISHNGSKFADAPPAVQQQMEHVRIIEQALALAQPQAGEEVARLRGRVEEDDRLHQRLFNIVSTLGLFGEHERGQTYDAATALDRIEMALWGDVPIVKPDTALTKDSPAPVSGEGCIPDEASPALKRAARELANPAQDDAAGIVRELVEAAQNVIPYLPNTDPNFGAARHSNHVKVSQNLRDAEAKATAYLNQQGEK